MKGGASDLLYGMRYFSASLSLHRYTISDMSTTRIASQRCLGPIPAIPRSFGWREKEPPTLLNLDLARVTPLQVVVLLLIHGHLDACQTAHSSDPTTCIAAGERNGNSFVSTSSHAARQPRIFPAARGSNVDGSGVSFHFSRFPLECQVRQASGLALIQVSVDTSVKARTAGTWQMHGLELRAGGRGALPVGLGRIK